MGQRYDIGVTVFNNWVIKRKIGEGSFGRVFEIQREDMSGVYHAALKVISVPQTETEVQAVLEEGMTRAQAEQYFYGVVEDIVREFAIMARLKGTANVVGYEDHAVIPKKDGIGWDILIRMELLTPLLTYAYAHPFSRRDIIKLGIDLCKALELCQKYQVIHRDIKPENVFVSPNGDFKLGDFGIARTIDRTMSGLSKKGTYNYMAPEVYRGGEYGFSVDLYSLGLVLYRLLNKNRTPFLPPPPEPITFRDREQALARRMSGEQLPAPCYGEGRLAEIIAKACAFDAKERYSSPGQMRQELKGILYDEQDAELIYPDGDELVLMENQYVSHSKGDADAAEETVSETDGTQGIFYGDRRQDVLDLSRTESAFGRDADMAEGTSATEYVFHKAPKQKPVIDVPEEKPRKKFGWKAWVIVGVLAIAAFGGTCFYMQHKKQLETERQMRYQELMEQGTTLCQTEPEKAGQMFLEAQGLYPEESQPYVAYAYALYCAGDYDAGISYIENDLALGKAYDIKTQSKLSEILGAAYFEKEDYAAAASFFRLSTAGGDITVAAMRDYAVALGRLGDVTAADDVLRQMFDAGAQGEVTTYVQAEVDYALKNYLEAERGFRSVLDTTKDVLLQKRALRALAEVYRDCSALARSNQSPIYNPASKEVELLAWGIAEFGFRYDSTLWEMLAMAYFEAYHTDTTVGSDYLTNAAECFQRVMELGVVKDYLYSNLYTVYYELKDYEKAQQALKEYEERYPEQYMPHALRGMLYITMENEKHQTDRDYTAAAAEYEMAGQKIKTNDDTTYFQQLESLIRQLENEGWL